jgi:hypothetical protein
LRHRDRQSVFNRFVHGFCVSSRRGSDRRGADQRFYAAPLSIEQKIGAYDWHGALLAVFGGHGEAPGKYLAPGVLIPSPDTMLLVLGFNQAVWYQLDSLTGENRRLPYALNQPRGIAFGDKRFVTTSTGGMPGALFLSEPFPGGSQLGTSSSPLRSQFTTVAGLRMFRHITGDEREWFTMAQFLSPTMEVWQRGRRVRQVLLPAPWYEPYGVEAWEPVRRGIPAPEVITVTKSVWRDQRGLLWTITAVPDAHLPPHYRDTDRGAASEGPAKSPAPVVRPIREQNDAVIAVYLVTDSSVALIASQRFDQNLNRFLSDSVLAESTYPEPGLTRFSLYRFRLSGFLP